MELQQASRKRAKIKLSIVGPAGSGKTYSALLVAYGITNDFSKITVMLRGSVIEGNALWALHLYFCNRSSCSLVSENCFSGKYYLFLFRSSLW